MAYNKTTTPEATKQYLARVDTAWAKAAKRHKALTQAARSAFLQSNDYGTARASDGRIMYLLTKELWKSIYLTTLDHEKQYTDTHAWFDFANFTAKDADALDFQLTLGAEVAMGTFTAQNVWDLETRATQLGRILSGLEVIIKRWMLDSIQGKSRLNGQWDTHSFTPGRVWRIRRWAGNEVETPDKDLIAEGK